MLTELLDRARLLVVTGKGGTGKTTVAGALATAAARRGRRTLVVEVEGRQGLAALFGRPPLGYQETRVADGVMGLAVDPEESLREYLGRYGAAPLTRLLSWARLTRFVTAAAPGLGDILLVGKVWEATTRRRTPVRDAPPQLPSTNSSRFIRNPAGSNTDPKTSGLRSSTPRKSS